VGVPEPQADTQAELMAEAFGFYVDNLVTKEHLDLALEKQGAQIDARFAEQNARIDARFAQQERTLAVHTWMLGVIVVTVLAPTLKGLLL
jgi:hypothetical protein